MWPTGGSYGWYPVGTSEKKDPLEYALPDTAFAYYNDPDPLGGVGSSVAATLRRLISNCHVRVRAASIEAEFTQSQVYGVVLLDSFRLGAPCSLELTVYDDDGVTPLWSVGTSEGHENPYLMEPDQYAEQEIDVAQGSASLGTVTVMVIDPAQLPGDQDSGWMTERLSRLGLPDVAGHRCRLVRFISIELGECVLADGPAGPPTMDRSYAAFTWDIRDTRDTERRVRLWDVVRQSLVPDEILDGYQTLIPPAEPLVGHTYRHPAYPSPAVATIAIGLSEFPANGRRILIAKEVYESILARLSRAQGVPGLGGVTGDVPIDPFAEQRQFLFRWRAQGSSDPWKEIPGPFLQVSLSVDYSQVVADHFVVGQVIIEDLRVNPLREQYDPGADDLPAEDEIVEFFLLGVVPPDERHPAIVDGITAGAFARNVYDGLYSPRDPVTGDVVPSGIRYDDAALLAMLEPVHIRQRETVDDARDWLEQFIYAPLGMVPALDDDGRISPVSQVAPAGVVGLLTLENAIVEPSPDWDAGQRIINLVRFTYPRDYSFGVPEPPPAGGATRQVELDERSVLLEFRDDISIKRHGQHVLELDGSAFRAVGLSDVKTDADGAPVATLYRNIPVPLGGSVRVPDRRSQVAVTLKKWNGPSAGEPLPAGLEAEQGHQLAQLRQLHLLNRYSLGAPAIRLNVMRAATLALRAGSWVAVDLSWLPDYVTQRRGLIGLGQVVALGDLDCAWRRLLLELVVPILPES